MQFFDTHTHLDLYLKASGLSLTDCLSQCAAVNIQKIAIMGEFREQFNQLISLTSQSTSLIYAIGLHPMFLEKHKIEDLDFIEKLLENTSPSCQAIGEIGLDRYIPELNSKENWTKQCQYFEAQLEIAQKHNLPVCIHARHSHAEIYYFLKKNSNHGVIHGFSGSYEEAKRYSELGFKIGVGGVITYPRATKTREAIRRIPLEFLVLETDTPDMPINGFQGKLNLPTNLVAIFESLCILKKIDRVSSADQFWKNSMTLYSQSN